MRHYCTLFGSNYLMAGLTLRESLVRHSSQPIHLWILCLDDEVYKWFKHKDLDGVTPIALADLENSDKEFARTRANRTKAEYIFTSKSAVLSYIFKTHKDIPAIIYLDSDMYFFRDPEELFIEIAGGSVAITPHRFPRGEEFREKNGTYNAGFAYFANDHVGAACLAEWRSNCIAWCYDTTDDGRYADQGYLTDWPKRYVSVRVLSHYGINAALWNIRGAKIHIVNNKIMINNDELICYHFHAFKRLTSHLFNPSWDNYRLKPSHILLNKVYKPYAKDLNVLARKFNISRKPLKIERSHDPDWVLRRTFYTTFQALWRGNLIFSW